MSVPWPRSTLLRQSNSRWPLRRRGAGRGTAMLATVLLVAGLSSCDGGNEAGTTTARPPLPSSETSSTITAEPATTSRQANGAPGPGCINGRITPAPAEPLRTQPLDIIRSQMGVTGRFEVVEMRYFTGPEVPWILAPRPPVVHRWYVKAQLVDDPSFRARWLVEKRSPDVEGCAVDQRSRRCRPRRTHDGRPSIREHRRRGRGGTIGMPRRMEDLLRCLP